MTVATTYIRRTDGRTYVCLAFKDQHCFQCDSSVPRRNNERHDTSKFQDGVTFDQRSSRKTFQDLASSDAPVLVQARDNTSGIERVGLQRAAELLRQGANDRSSLLHLQAPGRRRQDFLSHDSQSGLQRQTSFCRLFGNL